MEFQFDILSIPIWLKRDLKVAFWDTVFAELDFEKSSFYIMEKVFDYGTWNDQLEIVHFYRMSLIRKEIINAVYLRKTVLNFLCIILHLQKTDFACYKKMQSNPIPWNY